MTNLICFKKNNRQINVKNDGAPPTASHGKYTKYVSIPRPPVVAAYDCNRRARAVQGGGSYWPYKSCPTPSIRLCPSDAALPFTLYRRRSQFKITFAMTISKAQWQKLKPFGIKAPTSVFPNGQMYVTLSRTSSFDNVAAAITEGHRQRIQNDSLVPSDTVYRKVL